MAQDAFLLYCLLDAYGVDTLLENIGKHPNIFFCIPMLLASDPRRSFRSLQRCSRRTKKAVAGQV